MATLKDKTKSLCQYCHDDFGTCDAGIELEFGNGYGNDNVVKCVIFQNNGSLEESELDNET